ncbi:MAG: hypothetical protein IT334_10690 [Thermomicrobiales bacterium]|nr:hypothetical protein [Thermomicrobiales bacterium]
MQRIFRMTGALVAALMVLFAAGPVLAAAQAGVTSATTYESPLYGYEVEWTDDWSVVDGFTNSLETSDQLRIVHDELGIWVDIWGFDTNRSAESMMTAYEGLLNDSSTYSNVEATPMESSLPEAGVVIFNYEFGDDGTPLEELTEFRPIDGAFIVTSVKSAPDRSLIAAGLVGTMITIDGDPIFPAVFGEDTGDDDPAPTPDPDDDDGPVRTGDGLEGNVYSSPNFGVALAFDEDVWEVNDEQEAEDDEGRDVLILDLIEPAGRLWLESYSTITRASDCIESAVDEAIPDDADPAPLEDANGDELAGTSRGVAWAAYTFENSRGEESATYVECRALPQGAGVFVATLVTGLDDFEDAFAATQDVLTTVNIQGGEPLDVDTDDEDVVDEPDEDVTPEPDDEDTDPVSGTVYESPTWGFELEVDESVWEIVRDRSRNDVDTLQLEGEGDLFVDVSSFEMPRRADAQSCVEDFVADFDFEIQVDDENDGGEMFAVLGVYEDDDAEEWSIVVACHEDPEGEYLVQIVAEAPIDAEDDLLDALTPLMNSIAFP